MPFTYAAAILIPLNEPR